MLNFELAGTGRWYDRSTGTHTIPKVALASRGRLCVWSVGSEHHLGQWVLPRANRPDI